VFLLTGSRPRAILVPRCAGSRAPPGPREAGTAARPVTASFSRAAPWPLEVAQMHNGGGFPIELVGGMPVVTAPEEVDIINAAGLRSALLQAAADGSGVLVADLTRTRFCDLAGLHALVAAHKRARAAGGELLLVVSGAAVLRVLAITGADRVIPNFTTLHDALAHLSPNGSKDHRGPDDGLGAVQGSQQARGAA
jgi:anti-anti-sigma factor